MFSFVKNPHISRTAEEHQIVDV